MRERRVGRITSRAAFSELQRSRVQGASGPVRVSFVAAAEDLPGVYPQVGYAIGRHCGTAVARNRLRRRMREVVREAAPQLPRGRYLVRVSPAATQSPPKRLHTDVELALQRAGRAAVKR